MPTKFPARPIDANSQPVIPQMKATGQKRSLVRGKSTRKKNPGKRSHHGG
ncbi:MAG: hypothetical protein J0I24_06125 [Thiomonas arsenitoxydans]|uniref:Uncharacterized protein n=1 Tax=Thiomonas arsenitoxydans (strain DSM 22701 / CIP 110005 / 3As) TaxID=426114 RepID=A0A8I1MXM6_THIA3|nr:MULTISPECIES: hypothetical protein [Thiomonas]MBN8743867.1 hypothetical protein [Thiomonas arsenitoxydans]